MGICKHFKFLFFLSHVLSDCAELDKGRSVLYSQILDSGPVEALVYVGRRISSAMVGHLCVR